MLDKIIFFDTTISTVKVKFTNLNLEKTCPDSEYYSVDILILKSQVITIEKVKKAIKKAIYNALDIIDVEYSNKKIKEVLKDGDALGGIYKGNYYITATSINKPKVLKYVNFENKNSFQEKEGISGTSKISFYMCNLNSKRNIVVSILELLLECL